MRRCGCEVDDSTHCVACFFRVVCLFNGLILYVFPPISQGHSYSVQSVRQPHISLVLKMLVLLRQLAALYKLFYVILVYQMIHLHFTACVQYVFLCWHFKHSFINLFINSLIYIYINYTSNHKCALKGLYFLMF